MFSRIVQSYEGSRVIVVGAGGIGGSLVQLLNGLAAKIFVADRDEAPLSQLRQLAEPGRIETRKIDVRDAKDVSAFFHEVKADGVAPDFLFYTAGVLNVESLAQTTAENWNRAVEINLNGAFYCVQAAAELMRPKQRGSILLLSSIAGIRARSGSRVNPVYNATKAAISAFVNGAAMQLRGDGIRINCISPGPTQTAMMDIQPATVHASVCEITLDHRMNNPVEVAETALFVAAHGRFTGEDIGMGGGAGLGG